MYKRQAINRLASCYTKCLKTFFGFPKYSSVTAMLMELGVPRFNTLIHNYNVNFFARLNVNDNILVLQIVTLLYHVCLSVCCSVCQLSSVCGPLCLKQINWIVLDWIVCSFILH